MTFPKYPFPKLNENTQSHPVGADIKLPEWVKKAALQIAKDIYPNYEEATYSWTSVSMREYSIDYLEQAATKGAQAVLERVQSLIEALEFYAAGTDIRLAQVIDDKNNVVMPQKGWRSYVQWDGKQAREALAKWKEGK